MIFDDTPNFWDAWGRSFRLFGRPVWLKVPGSDVEIHHLETRQPLRFGKVSVLEEGPLRAAVSAELKYGQSTINVVVRSIFTIGFVYRVTSFFLDLVTRNQRFVG